MSSRLLRVPSILPDSPNVRICVTKWLLCHTPPCPATERSQTLRLCLSLPCSQEAMVTSCSKWNCSWANENKSSKWQWNTLPRLQHLPRQRFSRLCWTRSEQPASALKLAPLWAGHWDQMISKGPFKHKLFYDSVIHHPSSQRKIKYEPHSACKQQNCPLNTQRPNSL